MADAAGIAGDRLRSFVARIERLNEEIAGLKADHKSVFDEAKATGFDPKIIRLAIRRRAMSEDDRQHEDAMLDTYEQALAGWRGTPLGDAAERVAAGIRAGTADIKIGSGRWLSEEMGEQLRRQRAEPAE